MRSDEWCTPDWLYKQLDDEFHFDIDLCATAENTKCRHYCTDYLQYNVGELKRLDGRETRCFMNPPYSNPKPFIEKAWEDSKHCRIVCLVKCDPSTKWWATFWDYEDAGPKPGCEVRFLPKRVKFDPPLGYTGKVSSPSFPSAIVIMNRRGL